MEQAITAVFVVALFSGCSVRGWIHLFNNAGREVVVEARDEKVVIAPATTARFRYAPDVSVTVEGNAHRYAITPVSAAYIRTTLTSHAVKLQLERDGSLLVLRADETPPIDAAASVQPEGYPLAPAADRGP